MVQYIDYYIEYNNRHFLHGFRTEEGQKILQSGGLLMNCNDFSSMVPAFLDDTLDNESLHAFLDHLDECKGCREELEIQYLVDRVFDEKSAGQEINLSKDLPAYIQREKNLLRNRQRLWVTAAIFESVAITVAILTVILYML